MQSNFKRIVCNVNDLKSIRKAERTKTRYENKGYTKTGEQMNIGTGTYILTYKIN